MKYKKILLIVIAILVILLIPKITNANVINGWYNENGYKYYYENGALKKGVVKINGDYYFLGEYSGRLQKGWIVSSKTGKKYYADDKGKLAQGFSKIDNYTYYFNDMCELQYGITKIDNNYYFLGEYSGRLQKDWVVSSKTGKKYYADDKGKLAQGFSKIDNYTYYFNDMCELQYGITKIDNDYYFLGEYSGRLQKGWVVSSKTGKKYYADDKGKLAQGFSKIDNYTYYFNDMCELQYGITKIDNNYYFLGEYSGKVQSGIVTSSIDNKTYCVSDDGKLINGFMSYKNNKYLCKEYKLTYGQQEANGENYFLGEYTGRLQIGLIKSALTNKVYYANENGVLLDGIQKIEDDYRIFDRKTKENLTGIILLDDKIYYATTDGKLLNGIVVIDGVEYEFLDDFSLANGFVEKNGDKYYYEKGKLLKGITVINNEMYFLGEYTGKVQTGWVISSKSNEKYYTDENGKIMVGLKEIDGKFYFFNSNGILQTGKINAPGTGYYISNKEGVLCTKDCNIDNVNYHLNDDFTLMNGFYENNGGKYYYEEGILQTGIKNINSNDYFLGEYTGKVQIGWVTSTISGDTYYTNNEGVIQKNITEINGIKYFLGEITGKLQRGWVYANTKKIYYTDNNGIIQTGMLNIDGRDYTFNENGELKSGFQIINGNTYYIEQDGKFLTGINKIAGKRYRFDQAGVLRDKDFKIIADVSYHQGYINWDTLWNSGEIDGVILRAGYGTYKDKNFDSYISNVKRLNIPYGVYLFSYASNREEAIFEANAAIEYAKNLNLTYPFYYDIEGWTIQSTGENTNGITTNIYDEIINSFIEKMNNSGIQAKVYTGLNYAMTRLNENSRKHVDWIAHYTMGECGYNLPHRGWQYTSTGSLPGISGNVDLSIFYY